MTTTPEDDDALAGPTREGTEQRDDGEEQVPTGLGSGAVSGLGHSQTHEPDPLLESGTGTVDEDR